MAGAKLPDQSEFAVSLQTPQFYVERGKRAGMGNHVVVVSGEW